MKEPEGKYLSEADIQRLIKKGQFHPTHEGGEFVRDVLMGKGVNPSIEKMRDTFNARTENSQAESSTAGTGRQR